MWSWLSPCGCSESGDMHGERRVMGLTACERHVGVLISEGYEAWKRAVQDYTPPAGPEDEQAKEDG